MGKRIVSQARGKGSLTYRVKRSAFRHRIKYPGKLEGNGKIIKLIHSAGHSAPLAKIQANERIFFIPAALGVYEGQEISFSKEEKVGDITQLKNISTKTNVYNIESKPSDGGKFIRTAGSSATILKKEKGKVTLLFPSKKQKIFNSECRATIGIAAGGGRLDKPIVKAGKQYYTDTFTNTNCPQQHRKEY